MAHTTAVRISLSPQPSRRSAGGPAGDCAAAEWLTRVRTRRGRRAAAHMVWAMDVRPPRRLARRPILDALGTSNRIFFIYVAGRLCELCARAASRNIPPDFVRLKARVIALLQVMAKSVESSRRFGRVDMVSDRDQDRFAAADWTHRTRGLRFETRSRVSVFSIGRWIALSVGQRRCT